MAYTYLKAEKPYLALQAYRRLQTVSPNYAQIHKNLAYLGDKVGHFTASQWERERASWIEHNGQNHRFAAVGWMQHGDPLKAIAHMRHALAMERDREPAAEYYWWHLHDEFRVELARYYTTFGNSAQAQREMREARIVNSRNVGAVIDWVKHLRGSGDAEGADAFLALLIEEADFTEALLLVRAEQEIDEGRFDKALSTIEQVVFALSPAPSDQAPQESTQKIAATALPMLQELVAHEPLRGRCFHAAGWIYAALGQHNEAETFLAEAYKLMEQDPKVAEHIGILRAHRDNNR